MRGQGVLGTPKMWAKRGLHGVMVVLMERGQSSSLTSHLALLLLSTFSRLHHGAGAGLVGWVEQERPNVVDEERIQELCNLLLVRKVQGSLERNPAIISKDF
jgi:hypothetical protein